jgi:hypothetical protein
LEVCCLVAKVIINSIQIFVRVLRGVDIVDLFTVRVEDVVFFGSCAKVRGLNGETRPFVHVDEQL